MLDNDSPLTVLRGAWGSGKTAVLAEWARAADSAVAWVTVERDGSSSDAVAHDVLRALARQGIGASSGALTTRPWCAVAERLQDAERPVVIVLDDASMLTREGVFEICRIIANAPRARLIAATNRRSAFDGDGLDLAMDRTLIGPDALWFDAEEISRALQVDAPTAAEILAATGGFPALIHAASKQAALGAPTSLLEATSPAVEEFMRARIERSGFDREALDALLRCSVADSVDVSSARALAGVDHVERILDDAEAFGFGHWDSSRDRLFTFVPLAQVLLRRELGRSHAGEIPRLKTAAVAGALRRRAPFEALRLAVESDDLALASHVIMAGWSQLLDSHGVAVVHLLRRIPTSRLKDQPLVAMLLAVCYIASKLRRLRGLQLMRVAISAANSPRKGVPPMERIFIWAAESAALRIIGMSDRAGQVAVKAVSLLDTTPESAWGPYAEEMPPLCAHLGISLYYGGHKDRAVELFEHAASLAASHDLSRAFHGIALLSGIHALNGDMPEARHYVDLIREGSWEQAQLDGYRGTFYRVAEALIAVEAGDIDAAREHISVFGPHRSTSEHWPTMGVVEAWVALHGGTAAAGLEQLESLRRLRGRDAASAHARDALSRARALLHLALGETAAAREILQRDANPARFATVLERARVALVEGRAAEASRMLTQTRLEPETARQRAESAAVQSAALHRTAGAAAAERPAEARGIQLADRELTTPTALFDPDDLASLRAALTKAGTTVALPERAAFPATSTRPRLSSRETVVLRALTSGASLQAIATELSVSQNTLKTQLRSIYRKLEARNRAEAVEKAAEHDLLSER